MGEEGESGGEVEVYEGQGKEGAGALEVLLSWTLRPSHGCLA